MDKNNEATTHSEGSLMQRAEGAVGRSESSARFSEEDVRVLCHDLEVHQVELEMQNEELRRAQAELVASQSKYKDLYEFAPIGYLTLGITGRISEANLAAASLLGSERLYLVNNHFQAYLSQSSISEFNALISRVLESDVKQAAELQLWGEDKKSPAWVMVEARAIKGDPCKRFRMAVIDITARKKMEEALLEMNSDLALARDLALKAAEAKETFLANMSHELRTPMNAVIGFSSLLLDEDLTPDQEDYVEHIRRGGEALLALINDILDYTRMGKKMMALDLRSLSLKSLVEESLSMVATQAAEKGLSLSHAISYGTPDALIGDQGRLRQVLVNLLSNAVKFTDKGKVSVSVSSEALGENKHRFLFEVEDTGIGISGDSLEKLFMPFSQVDMSTTRRYGGTGLGLAISKSLVELMGGEIWAKSTPARGSKFSFTIDAEARLDLLTDSVTSNAVSENLAEKNPMRILVAEDNSSNQKVLLEMLRKLGYKADMAADGLEVLQAVERQPYDLILMDVWMPEMDGLEATRRIRSMRPSGPKIVAITASALDGDREKCIDAGMDDYIAKPVKKGELAAMLRNILE